MQPTEAFSSTYALARERFLGAAQRAGLPVSSYLHPMKGREGEALAVDVALDGAPDSPALLIVSSGCHGVEGFCGSGVQLYALHDDAWRRAAAAAGFSVLYVHALNPYGFSHLRRVTHENVDLNRNFQDFTRPLPPNPSYAEVHGLLLPERWPPGPRNVAAIGWYLATRGVRALQQAVSSGQYEFADGLFFGGTAPAWSNTTAREILRQHAKRARKLAWIDLHSGLGKRGTCERVFAGDTADAAALARARRCWDGQGATPVKSLDDGTSVSAKVTGMMWLAAHQECPAAELTSICLEFGSQSLFQVLRALRAEQWLTLHPETPPEVAAGIKQAMREAFYVDTCRRPRVSGAN